MMNIGVFDSGLGGLIILKAITHVLPEYDYVYLGDTGRVPYGDRRLGEIYEFTKQGVAELFRRDCSIAIIACNTASAQALRRLQQEWLPRRYPDRKILGVVVPTLEFLLEHAFSDIRVIATAATVHSHAYKRELAKIDPKAIIIEQALPELVPLIEQGNESEILDMLGKYLSPDFMRSADALVLGCTHYALVKDAVRRLLPPSLAVVSQDEVIPAKLQGYLNAHPEIESGLGQNRKRVLLATKVTPELERRAKEWFTIGSSVKHIEI